MKNQCGHEQCECEARAESEYCSEFCEQHAKEEHGEGMECSCGHLGCGAGMTNETEDVEYA